MNILKSLASLSRPKRKITPRIIGEQNRTREKVSKMLKRSRLKIVRA